jgi:hypothetical protein
MKLICHKLNNIINNMIENIKNDIGGDKVND